MKFVVLFSLIALVASQCDSDCWKEIRGYRKKCMELLEFTEDEKAVLKKWEYPNNEPRHEFMLDKYGVLETTLVFGVTGLVGMYQGWKRCWKGKETQRKFMIF
uniref:Uncharacterized protein n=1 Tax=Megaselia scalaris TaxID=36166 RepID=T1H1P1_MEGSC